MLSVGYFSFFQRGGDPPSLPEVVEAEVDAVTKVVVFPFKNLSGDPARDELSQIVQHQVTAGLIWAEQLLVIPAAQVRQVRGMEPETVTDREVAARLGANIMVTGIITSPSTSLSSRLRPPISTAGRHYLLPLYRVPLLSQWPSRRIFSRG